MKFLFLIFLYLPISAYGVLAGGRPNAISGGTNAFAGVVNPANAVWIEDRFDLGAFIVYQRSFLNNRDNNPFFPPGKIDMSYQAKTLTTADAAFHKKFNIGCHDSSISLAVYSTPSHVKVRTKEPFLLSGTTPVYVQSKTQVFSAVFSFKFNLQHSVGVSADYFYLSYERRGSQRSDNPLRSVSPGHVTNNGVDHSGGVGFSLGWRWNITKTVFFGAAYVNRSYVGQFKKYRGYLPHHGENFIPATCGAGFTKLFTEKLAGRLEVLWTNLGSLPGANNNILKDGSLNRNKRGSNKSPGPGLQDATLINIGLGYKFDKTLSLGAGFSHRIKIPRHSSNILSHSYALQTVYNLIAFGVDYKYEKHDFFLSLSHGFKNKVSGNMPIEAGGGKFTGTRSTTSLSLAWGYLY